MKNTKRARIVRALKALVLNSPDGISRAQAAESLDIDLRTAAAYLEQLTSDGLLKRECIFSGQKGRPGGVYKSNAEALCFLGLGIFQNMTVCSVVVDGAGRELAKATFKLPENASRLSVFSAIRDLAIRFLNVDGRRLYGIGLAISRWLQPPLAGGDTYANLADYLEREIGVAVYRDVNINTVAYATAAATTGGVRNLAVIHPGMVIEFGLVLDGEPDRNFTRREAWLSHMCVNPRGRRCYCGKYGCLENYVTAGALKERLLPGGPAGTVHALGEMLGMAMVRIAHKFPVEAIVLLGVEELYPWTEEYFKQHNSNAVRLSFLPRTPGVEYGAALEAAHFELQRFTENHQPPDFNNSSRKESENVQA